jgi:hypothetical protein
MSALIFEYMCANCGFKFEASGVSDFSYGEFIMRSESGLEVFLDASVNTAFMEVLNLVRTHTLVSSMDAHKSGEIAQKVFGVACDLSPKGERYQIELLPLCPKCLSRNIASWQCAKPPRESAIFSATQRRWQTLSPDQKKLEVDQEVKRIIESVGGHTE